MSAARIDNYADAQSNLRMIGEQLHGQKGAQVTLSETVAIAQLQATLALVEQQRIASIAILASQGLITPDAQRRAEILEALGLA